MSESQPDSAPKPPPSVGHATTNGIVVVQIGPDKIRHHVHKALLVHHAEYFAKALNGPWLEAKEQVVDLEEVGADEFVLFVHWLYTQQLPETRDDFQNIVMGLGHVAQSFNPHLVLVRAYALGDRILASVFRREINNLLVGRHLYMSMHAVPTQTLVIVTYAFATICTDRPILQYLVNLFCEQWDPRYYDYGDKMELLSFPPAFTARVIMRFGHLLRGRYEGCFREHASDEETKTCGKGPYGLC